MESIAQGSPSVNCEAYGPAPLDSPEFPVDHVSEDDRNWWRDRTVHNSEWFADLAIDRVADSYGGCHWFHDDRDQSEIEYYLRGRHHDRPGDMDQAHYRYLGRSAGYVDQI